MEVTSVCLGVLATAAWLASYMLVSAAQRECARRARWYRSCAESHQRRAESCLRKAERHLRQALESRNDSDRAFCDRQARALIARARQWENAAAPYRKRANWWDFLK